MVQSLNSTVELTTTGVSYLAIGGNKVGKFLLGNKGFEFYNDKNINDYIQIPWDSIDKMGANITGRKISRHFEVYTTQGKFLFASKDSGKILKIARQHIGDEKVVRLPTLLQTIVAKFKRKK